MLGGLAVLFFVQRSFLFPIPTTARTAPQAAGFPEAEEHVLTTADGEKVIVWHVPARPGHPVVLYFHGNGDFLAGFFGRFREHHRRRHRGRRAVLSRLCRLERAAERAAGCCRMRRRPMRSRRRDIGADRIVVWGFSLGTGVAVALAAEQPVGKLILEAPYTSIADVAASAFRFARCAGDAGSVPFRRSASRGSRRRCWSCTARTIPRFRSLLASACLRWRTSRSSSSAFPAAATTISMISARIETARQFIDAAKGLTAASGWRILVPDVGDLRISMSAHGPMPRSAWIFPALAVLLFAVRHRARAHASRRRPAGWCSPPCCWRSCSAPCLRPCIMPR